MSKQKDELYYINEISYLIKQCWKNYMSERETFKELVKFLKRLKLNEIDHPYLVKFKRTMLDIKRYNCYTEEEIGKYLTEFYEYKINLIDENNKDV